MEKCFLEPLSFTKELKKLDCTRKKLLSHREKLSPNWQAGFEPLGELGAAWHGSEVKLSLVSLFSFLMLVITITMTIISIESFS